MALGTPRQNEIFNSNEVKIEIKKNSIRATFALKKEFKTNHLLADTEKNV